MIVFQEKPHRRSRIEIIPMIDVMMFLLVFFVLISLNVIPATGLRTTLPDSNSTTNLKEPKVATVTIGADGTLQLNGTTTTIDKLADGLTALQGGNARLSIIINGDADSRLQSLVSVMDEIRRAKFDQISIAAKQR